MPEPTLSSTTRRAAGIALASLALSDALHAASWDWGSEARLSGRYNDNPALVENNPQSTNNLVGTVQAELIRATPNSKLDLRPRVSRNYYPDKDFSNLEQTNWFLAGNGSWQRPRTTLSLSLRYSDEGITESEASDDDTAGGTTLRVDDTRNLISIGPGISWIISEVDQVTLRGGYTVIDYDLDFTGRADSDLANVSLSYLRSFSPRQQFGFVASISRNESERLLAAIQDDTFTADPPVVNFPDSFLAAPNVTESDTVNLSLDYVFSISEDLNLSARVGRAQTDTLFSGSTAVFANADPTDFLGDECDAIDPIAADDRPFSVPLIWYAFEDCDQESKTTQYQLDFTRSHERGKYGIGFFQSVVPGSTGFEQKRTQITLSAEYRFTEKLVGKARVFAYDQEAVILSNSSSTDNFSNRNYRGNFSVDWLYSRNWAMGAEYIFRRREGRNGSASNSQAGGNQDINNNQVGFYIRYYIEKAEL